jgi:CRISPR-associated protein Cas2
LRFIICYDIADDFRRDRVATTLLNYGRRIQESVFMATLDEELYSAMLKRLEQLVDESIDTVHVFTLCAACHGRIQKIGQAELQEDRPYYIV